GLELLPELVGTGEDREKNKATKAESQDLVPKELENPFEGLLAQRVGCLQCGYVEAIRMQTFTSLSLPMSSTVILPALNVSLRLTYDRSRAHWSNACQSSLPLSG